MAFLLQRVRFGVGLAQHRDFGGLNFHRLALALRGHQRAREWPRRRRGHILQVFLGKLLGIGHDLNVVDGGAVVDGDELHVLVAAAGANPAFDEDFAVELLAGQELL